MSVESVLSEILGVPCGNVKFSAEAPSCVHSRGEIYEHGTRTYYLKFTTRLPLRKLQIGSLIITSINCTNYEAILLKGEETSRIVRAIADELQGDD